MKTLIDLITEQVTNAFTGQGYDAKYGESYTFQSSEYIVNTSVTEQWLQQGSTSVHHS